MTPMFGKQHFRFAGAHPAGQCRVEKWRVLMSMHDLDLVLLQTLREPMPQKPINARCTIEADDLNALLLQVMAD